MVSIIFQKAATTMLRAGDNYLMSQEAVSSRASETGTFPRGSGLVLRPTIAVVVLSIATVLRLLAASQVALTALAFLGSRNSLRTRALIGTLAFSIIAYLVLPLSLLEWNWEYAALPLIVAANAIPALLYFLTRHLFQDESRTPLLPAAGALVYLGIALVGRIVRAEGEASPAVEAVVFDLVPQFAKLAFVAATIVTCLRGREADLVEPRRRLRGWFAIGLAAIVALVLVTELATGWLVPAHVETAGMLGMLIAALLVNLVLLRANPAFELDGSTHPRPIAPPPATDPVLSELDRLMTEERLYAEHDLRIADVAVRLRIPEYRLRRAINGNLGYRNFNQFVNAHRIREASRRLLSERHLPILSIALDVGFRSLSSFNQSFRATHAKNPTEFRASPPTESRNP